MTFDPTSPALAALAQANGAFAARYPGDAPARQPIHTVYGGAHLYKAETTGRLGELALRHLARYAPDAAALAEALGFPAAGPLAVNVYDRLLAKLRAEPVEDFRIDFEDGFGARPDAEEDAAAATAAREVARGLAAGLLPPFLGIRIKSFGTEWQTRGARTLEVFVETLLDATAGRLPDNFVVTLPKVTVAEQPRALVHLFEVLERRHGLPAGSLRVELMIETTQALLGADGRSPLPAFLDACAGRCRGAHFGTYDFTASCNITAAYQTMDHPWCDLAKGMMMLAYGGTGLFLSDGATNVMPVGPHRGDGLTAEQEAQNRAVVHAAWRLSHRHIRRSLEGGFYQGWDLHPGQLPVRYATCFAFFLEGFAPAAERLRAFVEKAAQATLVGDVFDDAATGQGLLNYFLRALNSGAIDAADMRATGLTPDEVALRSFAKILAARRQRLSGG
ncbi:MAG TPA: phosphoenolpyruvate kinase [Polyangia bacterium]|nr:phosphoenolpyruvate kinase [Polyangia bacterium]